MSAKRPSPRRLQWLSLIAAAPCSLTTTDPAAHLTETLGVEVPGSRSAGSIHRTKRAGIVKRRSPRKAPRSMNKDARCCGRSSSRPATTRSPCSRPSQRSSLGARRQFVVLDTAPTGHTLKLLDTAGEFHRQFVPHEPADGRATDHHALDATARSGTHESRHRRAARDDAGVGSSGVFKTTSAARVSSLLRG